MVTGEPVFGGALAGTGPVHHRLCRPMAAAQFPSQRLRDHRSVPRTAVSWVISPWKKVALFRKHLSVPLPLELTTRSQSERRARPQRSFLAKAPTPEIGRPPGRAKR